MGKTISKKGREHVFLLQKYYNLGWLNRRYLVNLKYVQPYSAEDRLFIGQCLYEDFLIWQRGTRLVRDYEEAFVDISPQKFSDMNEHRIAERFRSAVSHLSKTVLPVVYRIVLEEREIKFPSHLSAREKLYFNDEVKGLLCRGLDELIKFRHR